MKKYMRLIMSIVAFIMLLIAQNVKNTFIAKTLFGVIGIVCISSVLHLLKNRKEYFNKSKSINLIRIIAPLILSLCCLWEIFS
ncbi:hypothetical protein [Gottfriedia acidiceleris]|uniref:hypothetical protein n=1 Tax=Gottfriedia acidiceleris TaxID=371036 RepID=UPI00101B963A|nr:hypothetical protein [Gottfriedia acidiceleris]